MCKNTPSRIVLRATLLVMSVLGHLIAHTQPFLNLDVPITIAPADKINTKHLEYAPTYYGSGIVFVQAKETPQDKLIDKKIGMAFFELMYAELNPDGLPDKARSFSPNIRTRFHEGPAAFSSDLQQIYFTRTNMSHGQSIEGSERQTTMKIYLADKGPDDWLDIRQLPFCSDEYSVMSPTLSPDDMQLIFMSDMPGGMGGWDLYISTRYTGVWSDPVNLGPTINTPKDEALPYWHPRGVLFFSSDGHPGLGRLDLFAAQFHANGTFSAPLNLGTKFNTRKDDLTFICDEKGLTGFFASSRKESMGKDDIYFFRAEKSIFENWVQSEPALAGMQFRVRDNVTLAPVSGVSAWVFEMGDGGAKGVSGYFDSEVIEGNEDQSVVIRMKPGPDLEAKGPHFTSDGVGVIPVKLDPRTDYLVVLRGEGYRQREAIISKSSISENIDYFLDIDPLKEPEFGTTANEEDCNPTGAVVIANSTYKPLARVSVHIKNVCDGTTRVIETDTEGRFRICLLPDCEYEMRLSKQGYLAHQYRSKPGLNPEEKVIYLTEADLADRKEGPFEPGDVLILDHIYYDFNKSAIRTGEAQELNSLAEMMLKHNTMTIELESHTDSRGDAGYNLELSERRGESAKEFLVARGVEASRIVLKPMGEHRLRNGCTDGVPCSEEEHQQNRRTEIHILSVDPKLEIKYSDQQD